MPPSGFQFSWGVCYSPPVWGVAEEWNKNKHNGDSYWNRLNWIIFGTRDTRAKFWFSKGNESRLTAALGKPDKLWEMTSGDSCQTFNFPFNCLFPLSIRTHMYFYKTSLADVYWSILPSYISSSCFRMSIRTVWPNCSTKASGNFRQPRLSSQPYFCVCKF